MRLEIESVDIEDIQPGENSKVENRILQVNTEELRGLLLEDAKLADVEFAFVYPGDKTRIVNLYDVVQPRCKIDRVNADFPGFIGRMQTAGHGRTRALRGVTVLVSNPASGPWPDRGEPECGAGPLTPGGADKESECWGCGPPCPHIQEGIRIRIYACSHLYPARN